MGIIEISRFLGQRFSNAGPFLRKGFVGLVGVLLILPLGLDARYYFFNSPERNSALLYGRSPFAESAAIAAYLSAHTSGDDSIALFGSEPQILYYARRLSATKYIMTYYVVGNYRDADKRRERMKEELKKNNPAYAVYFNMSYSLGGPREREFLVWIRDSYLAEEFELAGIFFRDDSTNAPEDFQAVFGQHVREMFPELYEGENVFIYKRKSRL